MARCLAELCGNWTGDGCTEAQQRAFGPQGRECAALIESARSLNADEIQRLRAAVLAAQDAAWMAAHDAAHDAAREAAREAAWGAAGIAARDAAGGVAWAAPLAAGAAAAVLVVRDLIGRFGFTQQHYDLLTEPWRRAIGPVHPDDASMAPA